MCACSAIKNILIDPSVLFIAIANQQQFNSLLIQLGTCLMNT